MDPRTELVDVIRRVRNRWRVRLALRGAVVVVAGTVLALLLSASGLESFRFSAPAIITFRIVTVAVFVGLLFYGLVWPLRRRVTDAQVAMYLEECDPTLEAAIISAVEATSGGGSGGRTRRAWSRSSSSRPSSSAARSITGARSSARRSSVTRRRSPSSPLRRAAHRVRPGVPAPRSVRAPRHLAQRRSVEPLQHRSAARQREGPARRGPGGEGEARGIHVDRRQRDDAHDAERVVRSRAAHRLRAARRVRRHAVPPREADGVLRRVERRPLGKVHALGRRSADRRRSSTSSTASPPTPACRRARSRAAATSPRSAAPRSSCTSCRR